MSDSVSESYFRDPNTASTSRAHASRPERPLVKSVPDADSDDHIIPLGKSEGVWGMIRRISGARQEGWLSLWKGSFLVSSAAHLLIVGNRSSDVVFERRSLQLSSASIPSPLPSHFTQAYIILSSRIAPHCWSHPLTAGSCPHPPYCTERPARISCIHRPSGRPVSDPRPRRRPRWRISAPSSPYPGYLGQRTPANHLTLLPAAARSGTWH